MNFKSGVKLVGETPISRTSIICLSKHTLRQWPCSQGAESDAGSNWHYPCQGCPRTQAIGAARLVATYDRVRMFDV
jgi:hypothetical protein